MAQWNAKPYTLKASRILMLGMLVCSMAACSGDKKNDTKPDMAKKVEVAPPKAEPDMKPPEDPLKEAKANAEELGTEVAVGRNDIATLAASNIEAALKNLDSGKKPRPRVAVTKEKGKIDPAAANKVFRKFDGAMKKCYERALKASPGLEGKVNLVVVVNTDGSVKSASARQGSLRSPMVSKCIEGLAKRMKFPKPTGGAARLAKGYKFSPEL